MNRVNYATILRHAADSSSNENRHNQASILKDAAQAFEEMQQELAAKDAALEAARKYMARVIPPLRSLYPEHFELYVNFQAALAASREQG